MIDKRLKRIILHWTGGKWKANDTDRAHYHYIVQGDGTIVSGTHSPKDNINCSDGNYAAHTGGGNTGSIGIAIAAMWPGYDIKRAQLEAFCEFVAKVAIKYNIPVTTDTILTHAEWGEQHPLTTSKGKPDISKLKCVAVYGVRECGNWLRDKINWYKNKLQALE